MNCPKCHYQFSKHLSSCPSCGIIIGEYVELKRELDELDDTDITKESEVDYPLKKENKIPIIRLVAVIFFVIGITAFVLFKFVYHEKPISTTIRDDASVSKTQKEEVLLDKKDESVVELESETEHEEKLTTPSELQSNQNGYVIRGIHFGAEGKIDKAKEELLKAAQIKPNNEIATISLKLVTETPQNEKGKEALKFFFQGLSFEIDNAVDNAADSYKQSVDFFKQEILWQNAIIVLKRALNLAPGESYLESYFYFELGLLYGLERKWDDAMMGFKKAVEIDPDNVNALYKLGTTYGINKMWNEAIGVFKNALTINPNDGELNYYLAMAYFFTENFELSVTYSDKATSLGYNVNPALLKALKPYR